MDRLIVLDLETFGLNPKTDFIIEVGLKIVDLDLRVIDDFQRTVWDSPAYDGRYDALRLAAEAGDKGSKIVTEMHNKSGLWSDAMASGVSVAEAIEDVTHWLGGHGIDKTDPLMGSTISFDRAMLKEQWPTVDDIFSYRSIDISSVKELCRRYNPGLYARLDEVTAKREIHRVLEDIDDTINEFKFYRDEFLMAEEFFS